VQQSIIKIHATVTKSAYRRFDGNIAKQTRLKTLDVGFEPTLPTFCDAANVCFRETEKYSPDNTANSGHL
jgi:hypothetical protein